MNKLDNIKSKSSLLMGENNEKFLISLNEKTPCI